MKEPREGESGASCGKRMIASTLAAASNHHRGRYASPALADASYPFVICWAETPCFANCFRPVSFIETSYFLAKL